MRADPSAPVDADVLRRMGRVVAYRGPDGEGVWAGPGVGLVHRRLSIIDLDSGAQPIAGEDPRFQVVCNGEMYDHLDLRRDLEARGQVLRARSDTEPILHRYEERGEGCVEDLDGVFACAAWDGVRRRLPLARGLLPAEILRRSKMGFGIPLERWMGEDLHAFLADRLLEDAARSR